MTKEELRKEFNYEIMKYNGQVSVMFEWFYSKLEEKYYEIKLQKAYYNTLDKTSQAIIASLEAKLKEKDKEIDMYKSLIEVDYIRRIQELEAELKAADEVIGLMRGWYRPDDDSHLDKALEHYKSL